MVTIKILLVLCICGTVFTKKHYNGDKVFRITPQTKDEVKMVHKWIQEQEDRIDVWKEPSHVNEFIDIHIFAHDVEEVKKYLTEAKLKFEITIEDLEKVVQEEALSNHNFAFAGSYNYYAYNRYDDIKDELYNLARTYPNAKLFTVGKTYEGRDMIGIKVSHRESRGPKEAIWIDGGIHAREWISPATVMFTLKQLLSPEEPLIAGKANAVLKKYDIYVLPVFNADGYEYSHTNERLWRKTRSKQKWGYYGADPNRNWDSQFKYPPIKNSGTSTWPWMDTFRGPYAFSEVEVKQVADKLTQLKQTVGLKSYWNVHAYSQLLLYPWSYTTARARDYYEIKRIADVFSTSLSKRYGKSFVVGQPGEILYTVAGGSIDWTYEKLGVKYSYAPELRPTQRERYGFNLPAAFIKPSGLEFCDGFFDAVVAMK